MRISFYLAFRFFFSKKKFYPVNIISWMSVFSLTISTIALSILLSVFSGLEKLNKNLYKKINPDIKVELKNGKDFISNSFLIKKIKNIKGIKDISQTIEEKVYLHYQDYDYLVYLKGVDSNYNKVMSFNKNLLLKCFISPQINEGLWIGLDIAQKFFFLFKNSSTLIDILAFKPGKKKLSLNSFYKKKVKILGIFHITKDINENYVYSSLKFCQNLLNKKRRIYYLEIKLNSKYNLINIKKNIFKILGNKFIIKTREEQQEALFKMINTENFFLYLLLCLILIITNFSLISSIIILILDKKNQIITLSNIGMSLNKIKNIFFYIGILITFSGWLIGIFIGYGLSFIQKKFSWIKVNQNIAFPVEFTLKNFILISFTVWIISLFFSYCSSRRILLK